jgi:ribonuclease P protein component
MQPERRLRKSREFAAVWREGRSRSDGRLVAIARRGESTTRFGFSVSKRLGKAVTRRLRKSREFAAVWREGRSRSDGRLVAIARRGESTTRFGFSVSKRLGKAVTRNKIKRRLKAAAASANVEEGWDVVVIARQGAAPASFWELRRSMKRLLKRLHVSTSKKRTARRTT